MLVRAFFFGDGLSSHSGVSDLDSEDLGEPRRGESLTSSAARLEAAESTCPKESVDRPGGGTLNDQEGTLAMKASSGVEESRERRSSAGAGCGVAGWTGKGWSNPKGSSPAGR